MNNLSIAFIFRPKSSKNPTEDIKIDIVNRLNNNLSSRK